jgi:hypothetical protein
VNGMEQCKEHVEEINLTRESCWRHVGGKARHEALPAGMVGRRSTSFTSRKVLSRDGGA